VSWRLSYYRKEFPQRDHSNAEAIGAREISGIEGDQEIGPAFHGQFQDEVVLWVG
jgi:hypothetical protein